MKFPLILLTAAVLSAAPGCYKKKKDDKKCHDHKDGNMNCKACGMSKTKCTCVK